MGLLLLTLLLYFVESEYRSFSGINNNKNNPNWGKNGELFQRKNYEYIRFDNNIDKIVSNLPNPRVISNAFSQLPKLGTYKENFKPLSGIAAAWSMVLTRELCNPHSVMWMNLTEYEPINIPSCDIYYDKSCLNNKEIPFYRAIYSYETNKFNTTQKYKYKIYNLYI